MKRTAPVGLSIFEGSGESKVLSERVMEKGEILVLN